MRVSLGDLEPAAQKSEGALGRLMSGLGGFGLAAQGVREAAGLVGGFFRGTIGAASDVEESVNKVNVVFGDSAGKVQAFASTAAQAMGQSRAEVLAAAGTFGNLFGSMGLVQDVSADMSTSVVGLASDLASFNNVPVPQALEAIRSGLVGESEPLRQFGVLLNEATVGAKGVELGLAATAKELTEADKVQARYALILEQTTVAQGDFARTSTGMANAQRIIQASFAEIGAEIGGQLLPVVAPLISQFAQALPAAVQLARDAFSSVGPTIASTATTLGDVWEAAQPVIQTIAGQLTPVLTFVGEHLGDFVIPALAAFAVAAGAAAVSTVLAMAPVVVPIVAIGAAVALLREAWENDWLGIRSALEGAWALMQPLFATIFETLGTFAGEVIPEAQLAWQNMTAAVQAAWQGLVDFLRPAIEGFAEFWQRHHENIERVAAAVWDAIVIAVRIAWDALRTLILTGLDVLQGDWEGAWGRIKTFLELAWIDIGFAVREGVKAILDLVGGLARDAFTAAQAVGTQLVEGIKAGFQGAVQGLLNLVQGAVNQAIEAGKRAVSGANFQASSGGGGGGGGGGGDWWGVFNREKGLGRSEEDARRAADQETGRRQAGGPVWAGWPFLVGESGPEVFVPRTDGFIVPNHELGALGGGSGGRPVPQVVVNFNNAVYGFQDFQEAVAGAVDQARRRGYQI